MTIQFKLVVAIWAATLILSAAAMSYAATRQNACDVARATLPKAVLL